MLDESQPPALEKPARTLRDFVRFIFSLSLMHYYLCGNSTRMIFFLSMISFLSLARRLPFIWAPREINPFVLHSISCQFTIPAEL